MADADTVDRIAAAIVGASSPTDRVSSAIVLGPFSKPHHLWLERHECARGSIQEEQRQGLAVGQREDRAHHFCWRDNGELETIESDSRVGRVHESQIELIGEIATNEGQWCLPSRRAALPGSRIGVRTPSHRRNRRGGAERSGAEVLDRVTKGDVPTIHHGHSYIILSLHRHRICGFTSRDGDRLDQLIGVGVQR
jgi:hypothetical protein